VAPDEKYFVITIGASAGGLNAVSEVVSQFPKDINAAIFIVLHLSKAAIGDVLLSRIQKNTSLPCKIATDKEPIKKGIIYFAAPDGHLLISERSIIIGHGPPENRFRPSIDVLFRSAAVAHGEKTIGIILTGFLNDGTVGMQAIKTCGGFCIVQDPNEAEYPDMPLSVLENMEVDAAIPLREMRDVIISRIETAEIKGIAPPEKIVAESKLSEKNATSIAGVSELGEKTVYACPDCGGGLWEIENGRLKHYRCHIGHDYTERDLLIKQSEISEQTLWAAVRMMEERKLLLGKIARTSKERGLDRLSNGHLDQLKNLDDHITKLKELLFKISSD
jgi:two-component system, chemotaxis family, protein-glutamate methylesterase/glutaminase